MGAENEVHYPERAFYPLSHMVLLNHAAADRNDLAGLFLFCMVQGADIAQNTHLRMFTDSACIYYDDIGFEFVDVKP